MLNDYFKCDQMAGDAGVAQHKRLLAVQAALEIVKASVSAGGGEAGLRKTDCDLEYTIKHLSELVEAIQDVLELEDEE
ncbi:hypothetical protein B1H39_24345 [Serratia marcescens]|nr:hypothetical protein B1H39_24345 [Serratia marcescens]